VYFLLFTFTQTDKSGKKKKSRRRRPGEEGRPDDDVSTASSQLSRASLSNGRGGNEDAFFSKGALRTGPAQQIVLGGKYMLPKKTQSSATASALSTMQGVVDRNKSMKKQQEEQLSRTVGRVEEEEEESSSSSDSEGSEGEGGEERVRLRREKKLSLRQKETPEEKKLRKAQVRRFSCCEMPRSHNLLHTWCCHIFLIR
jgi:hypothetical protein